MARGRTVPAAWRYDSSEWARVKERFGATAWARFTAWPPRAKPSWPSAAAGPNVPASPEQDALVWTFSDGEWLRVCREACGNSVSGEAAADRKCGRRAPQRRRFCRRRVRRSDKDTQRCGSLDLIGRTRMEPRARRPGGVRRSSRPGHARCDRNALGPPGRSRVGPKDGCGLDVEDGRVWTRDGVDAFGPLLESASPDTGIIEEPAGGRWVRRARTRRGNRRGRVGLGRRSGRVAAHRALGVLSERRGACARRRRHRPRHRRGRL